MSRRCAAAAMFLSGCLLWGCGTGHTGADLPEESAMEAMVLTDPSGNLYFVDDQGGLFTADIPEIMTDPEGQEVSADTLSAGDRVELYGDGMMQESYPGMYPGVTRLVLVREGTPEDAAGYQHLIQEIYEETDPSEPPSMNLEYIEGEIATAVILTAGSYEWNYTDAQGEGQSVIACGPHVLEWKGLGEVQLSGPAELRLYSAIEMESVSVSRWPAAYRELEDKTQADPGEPVEAVPGETGWVIPEAEPGYVYQVTVRWPQGYGDFGFFTV